MGYFIYSYGMYKLNDKVIKNNFALFTTLIPLLYLIISTIIINIKYKPEKKNLPKWLWLGILLTDIKNSNESVQKQKEDIYHGVGTSNRQIL